MMDINPVQIGKVSIPVQVDERGKFSASLNGHGYEADSRGSLRDLLEKAALANRVKTAVKFTHVAGSHVTHGTATGIHGGTGNLLVTWDSGRKEQLSSWGGRGEYLERLNDDETLELQALLGWLADAELALKTFREKHSIKLKEIVSADVEAAMLRGPGSGPDEAK